MRLSRSGLPASRDDSSKQWNQTPDSSAAASTLEIKTLATWWLKLNDPVLSSLIERAVLGNLDLREAKARVREARAQRGVSVADQFPSVDATASTSKIAAV